MTSFFLFQCFSDKPDRRFNSRGLNLLLNVKNKRSINCVDSSLPIYQASTFHNLLGLERQDNIPFPSCFLQSVSKRVFKVHFHANQTHFHMKAFAPGLVLKQRYKITQSWRISFNQLDICKETKTKIEGS